MAMMVTATATSIIAPKLLTHRKAMAPGAINSPTARMMPTEDSVATIVKDRMTRRP